MQRPLEFAQYLRALVLAWLASRRLLEPDENVSWNLAAIPTALLGEL